MVRVVRRVVAAGALVALPLALAAPVQAAPANKPGASAEAYGVYVDVRLLAGNIPVQQGPLIRATQDYPPGAAAPAEANLLQAGPIPAAGELVNNIGVVSSLAGATSAPQAVASSQAANVELFSQAGIPLITADLIRAQSNSDCVTDPNDEGTEFVNLRIAGQVDPIENPAPNTVITVLPVGLEALKIVINEQHPAADGRGLVVNAIHVYGTDTGDPLFRGDVVIAHAMSTVSCTNGKGSTGGPTPDIFMTKDVTPNTGRPGDTVTYNASVKNNNAKPCIVNVFIDHLPQAFDFVSTSGDLGTEATVAPREGGGVDLKMGNGVTIAPGATAKQKFVLKVRDDAAPGVYFNNLEIFCANLGNFVKGLDAPFEVLGPRPQATPSSPPPSNMPRTGGAADGNVALAVLLLAGAYGVVRLRKYVAP